MSDHGALAAPLPDNSRSRSADTHAPAVTHQEHEAVAGADAFVNLPNSLAFFQNSVDDLLAAGQKRGIRHFVILSIVRATQFMEIIEAILSWTADSDTVRLPGMPIQPIAARDVADAVAEVTVGAPRWGHAARPASSFVGSSRTAAAVIWARTWSRLPSLPGGNGALKVIGRPPASFQRQRGRRAAAADRWGRATIPAGGPGSSPLSG
ncbi:hypothetical protein WEB32_00985 [Streptomyces netropsis]|uniref:hypothetical protein n=1 Tax=Streptomyces netropsis TaxID=55404 RepID=UPI0030D1A942